MAILAVIGGSGLAQMPGLQVVCQHSIETPYGPTSSDITEGRLAGETVMFLARHGNPHLIPPHCVNYRANLWALKELAVDEIIAVNAVGGISERMGPEVLAVPDQLVDYTYGRQHSLYDGKPEAGLDHVEFAQPLHHQVRQRLLNAAQQMDVAVVDGGTYGVTQGPRLETAAEIRRLQNDGCELVGMTLMPEAGLAAELTMPYACLSLVVNWAAGCSDEPITMDEIERVLSVGMVRVVDVVKLALQLDSEQN